MVDPDQNATDNALFGTSGKRSGSRRRRHLASEHRTSFALFRHNIPTYDLLSVALIDQVLDQAYQIVERVGIAFPEETKLAALWKEQGAEFRGARLFIPRTLCSELIDLAPDKFVLHARNAEKSIEIGGSAISFAPSSGAEYVRDLDQKRRLAVLDDFIQFLKLGQMAPTVHFADGIFSNLSDVPSNMQHLEMAYAQFKYSDQVILSPARSPNQVDDIVEIANIVFGETIADGKCVMMGSVNSDSPLSFDNHSIEMLESYAAACQAIVISPIICVGATSPVSIVSSLAQAFAEILVGVTSAQLVRPGTPVLVGGMFTSFAMRNGVPLYSSAEVSQLSLGAAQIARHLNLPFRASGGLTSSKLPDGQAFTETSHGLKDALLSGANFVPHAAGALEAGHVACFEKFVIDAMQAEQLFAFAIGLDENQQSDMSPFSQMQENRHFLADEYTMKRYGSLSEKNPLYDDNLFALWNEQGAEPIEVRANRYCRELLAAYQMPTLNEKVDADLRAFVKGRVNGADVSRAPRIDAEVNVQSKIADLLHNGIWDGMFRSPDT